MATKLFVYPNCSNGGVASVIRGRAIASPDCRFIAVFYNDRGGRSSFDDLPNVEVRIVRKDRAASYLQNLIGRVDFDEISILSDAPMCNTVSHATDIPVTYEFHSSSLDVIQSELAQLDLGLVARIVAPSEYLVSQIESLLPSLPQLRLECVPNLVDTATFAPEERDTDTGSILVPYQRPIVWIGRFDKGKGFRQFLRIVSMLPGSFGAIAIVSLESDPQRATDFFSECDANRMSDRVTLFSDLSQREISTIYRAVRDRGGFVLCTSLMESFGYSVAEAISVGARVIAYDLPALHEHEDPNGLLQFVPIGSFSPAIELITSGNLDS